MRQRRLMNQINVVPYIDVMLVLLVIFMVTAPLLNPGTVSLPSVAKSSATPEAPMEVTIKADGAITFRDRGRGAGAERAVTVDTLVAAVKERQAKSPEQAVVIGADKDVRYERVMQVMDALQRANVKRVGLLVKPAQG
ncbi:MAG: protein TolR [Burkholderiales bacterium]|jgi:biopolymer transport protein TolR